MHVYGRVIRGKCPEHFLSLGGDDPERKVVMLMDREGLFLCEGKTGLEILRKMVCYKDSYIQQKLSEGYQFKLVSFGSYHPAYLATWTNAVLVSQYTYDRQVAGILAKHLERLTKVPFSEIERAAGYSFAEVETAGKTHPRYMTEERLVNSEGTLVDARAFLYFTLKLQGNYRGDGFTGQDDGHKGVREYFCSVAQLSTFSNCKVQDLEVTF